MERRKKQIIRSFRSGGLVALSVGSFVVTSSAAHFATQKYYFSNGQEVNFQNLLFSVGVEKYEIGEYDYPKNLSKNELLEAFERLQSFSRNVASAFKNYGPTSLSFYSKNSVTLDQLEEAGKNYIVDWIVTQVYGAQISSLVPYLPSLESLTIKFRNFKSRLAFIESQSERKSFLQEVKEIWNKAKRCFIHFEELTDQ